MIDETKPAELVFGIPPEIIEEMKAIRRTVMECARPSCQWGEFAPSVEVLDARRQYHGAELEMIRLGHWNEARDLVRKFA